MKLTDKHKVIVIMGKLSEKPKLLGADISPKQVNEALALDVPVTLYAASMVTYREVKKKSNGEAIRLLELAFNKYITGLDSSIVEVFPLSFSEAGL